MTADKSKRNTKCKKWEKERRDRLNESFNVLAKLLPSYDPSATISKLDILSKSADYIFKLKTKLNDSLSSNADNNKLQGGEITELQKQVNHLTSRNEQLASLLKEAKISIPTECGRQISIGKPKKWSGKITVEKADEINKFEAQKENKESDNNQKVKAKVRSKALPAKVQNGKKKVAAKRIKNKITKSITSSSNARATSMTFTNVPLQPVQPYYIIANNIASSISSQAPTFVKNVISAPILSTTNQPSKSFTGGIIYPVVQPAGLLNPLILNTVPQSNSLIVVKTNKTDQNPTKTTLPSSAPKTTPKNVATLQTPRKLKPKRRLLNQRLIQRNKIPITASRYESSTLWWSSAFQPIVKRRIKLGKRKRVQTECNSNKKIPSAKKAKVIIPKSTLQDTTKKSQNSDYSIDALCKENQTPTGKEVEIHTKPKVNETLKEHSERKQLQQKIVVNPSQITTVLNEQKQAASIGQDNKIGSQSNQLMQNANNLHIHQLNYQQKQAKPVKSHSINSSLIEVTSNQAINGSQSTQLLDTHSQNQFQISPKQEILFDKSKALCNKQAKLNSKANVDNIITQQIHNHMPHPNHQLALHNQNSHQLQTQNSQVIQQNTQQAIQHNSQRLLQQQIPQQTIQQNSQQQLLQQNSRQVIQQNSQQLRIQPSSQQTMQSGLQQNQQQQQLQQQTTAQPELNLHSELSNDIFASLQVQGSQNPESTSPTAAFLNAFPLVSSFTGVKVAEAMEEDTTSSPNGTPTLLQIGNLEANHKSTQNNPDNLTPSIMNLDNFNFFSNNLYNNFDNIITTTTTAATTIPQPIVTTTITKQSKLSNNNTSNAIDKSSKLLYNNQCLIMTSVSNEIKDYRNSGSNTSNIIDKKPIQAKVVNNSNNVISQNNTKTFAFNNAPCVTTAQPFYDHTQATNSSKAVVSSGINFNATNRCNEYNTFNPFELPKTTQPFVKNHNDPSYGSANCNYNYQTTDYNYQLGKNNYYDASNCNFYNGNLNPNTNNSSNSNSLNLNTSHNLANNSKYNKKALVSNSKDVPSKAMVNWMAPDFAATSTAIAKVTSYSDIGQNNYLNNTNALYTNDYQNATSITMDTHQHQEHQFPWSPTKLPQLMEPSHNFPPSTLPTLVGDLALGISTYSSTTSIFDNKKQKQPKKQTQSFEQGNFLSVSQLVEHNKESTPQASTARIANRRNSGNRTSHKQTTTHSKAASKRHNKEKDKNGKMCEVDWDAKRNKIQISNYSAESLIGAKQQNYPKTIPPYMPDNLLPYFPHNMDENFPQSNQNYHQNNTFTTNYNNTFMQSSTTTTYLPSTNFLPEIFDNPIENIFSHVNPAKSNSLNQTGSTKKNQQKAKDVPYSLPTTNAIPGISTTTKNKTKKKDAFVDLSFLSMPPINSPLLPEDYHSNFLPPPPNPNQLYSSCKNPMYKQTSGNELSSILTLPSSTSTVPQSGVNRTSAIQHPEISPASGTLTNFNLCTIFPEINRASNVVPDVFRNYGNNPTVHKNTNYLPTLE